MTKKVPEWFKTGATVRIVKELHGHMYEKGEIIVLGEGPEDLPAKIFALFGNEREKYGRVNKWWVTPADVEPVKLLTVEEILG